MSRSSATAVSPSPGSEETISKKKKSKKGSARTADATAATLPRAKVRDYSAHVFVCKGGDCKKRGSKETRKALKDELRAGGINRDVRVDSVDCLGLCKHGPNVVVYPGGTWYLGLEPEDVPEVVEQHLKDGEPVERLAADLRAPRGKRRK